MDMVWFYQGRRIDEMSREEIVSAFIELATIDLAAQHKEAERTRQAFDWATVSRAGPLQ